MTDVAFLLENIRKFFCMKARGRRVVSPSPHPDLAKGVGTLGYPLPSLSDLAMVSTP